MSVLVIENLKKTYQSGRDELVILEDLDFHLGPGEAVAITGDSGCGKSTLMNLIAGLDTPTKGTISSCGRDISALPESKLHDYRSLSLGLVFQFHFLLKELTALENVFLPGWMAGMKKAEAQDRALSLLASVGLTERSHHYPGELSGGERQRVALARALINRPPLLLADEPTGNLDESSSSAVEDLLLDMVKNEGTSLVLVTHDLALAQRLPVRYRLEHRKLWRHDGL